MFNCFESYEEKQAKLLAKSIKRAYGMQTWRNNPYRSKQLAYEIAQDPNVSTKYIPVRDVIKILQNGDLSLAMEIFDGKRKEPIIHRATHLIIDLFNLCSNGDENFQQVADTMNWLKILMLIKIVKITCSCLGTLEAINYLYQEAITDGETTLEDLIEVPKIVRYVVKSGLELPIDVKTILPYFLKIFKPTSANPCSQNALSIEYLMLKFPSDIVLDSKGHLCMYKTLGIDERVDPALLEFSFKGRMNKWTIQKSDLDNESSTAQIQNADNLPEEDVKCYLTFQKILQLKAEGITLEQILEQLNKESCVLTEKSIKLIYAMPSQSPINSDMNSPQVVDEFMDTISPNEVDTGVNIAGKNELV